MLGEQGGWPLTMFLTPDGEPFWGGTYFPPSPRYGRPGFTDVLRALSNTYRSNPEKVARNVGALKEALGRLSQPQRGSGIPAALADQIAERLLRRRSTPSMAASAARRNFPSRASSRCCGARGSAAASRNSATR